MQKLPIIAASCLLYTLSSLFAQEAGQTTAEDRHQAASERISASWNALETALQTDEVSAEERIRRIDEWQAAQQANFDELRAVRREIALSRPRLEPPPEHPIASEPLDPIRKRIREIDNALVNDINLLESKKFSPEQRISEIDGLIERHAAAQAERRQLQGSLSSSQNLSGTNMPKPEESEIRKILRVANSLSPEERIAEIDRRQTELDQILRESSTSRKLSSPSSTSNP